MAYKILIYAIPLIKSIIDFMKGEPPKMGGFFVRYPLPYPYSLLHALRSFGNYAKREISANKRQNKRYFLNF